MDTKFNGYAQAAAFDKELVELAEKHTPQENSREWLRYLRTIKTSLDLLEQMIMQQTAK